MRATFVVVVSTVLAAGLLIYDMGALIEAASNGASVGMPTVFVLGDALVLCVAYVVRQKTKAQSAGD